MKKIIALVLIGLFISTSVFAVTKYKKIDKDLFEVEETYKKEISRESLGTLKAHLELNIIGNQKEIDKLQKKIDEIDAILKEE